jgi:hypothetical protein
MVEPATRDVFLPKNVPATYLPDNSSTYKLAASSPTTESCHLELRIAHVLREPCSVLQLRLRSLPERWQRSGPKGILISFSFRGLKPPAPSEISDLQLKYSPFRFAHGRSPDWLDSSYKRDWRGELNEASGKWSRSREVSCLNFCILCGKMPKLQHE